MLGYVQELIGKACFQSLEYDPPLYPGHHPIARLPDHMIGVWLSYLYLM